MDKDKLLKMVTTVAVAGAIALKAVSDIVERVQESNKESRKKKETRIKRNRPQEYLIAHS